MNDDRNSFREQLLPVLIWGLVGLGVLIGVLLAASYILDIRLL